MHSLFARLHYFGNESCHPLSYTEFDDSDTFKGAREFVMPTRPFAADSRKSAGEAGGLQH
jgi:hypothetical protein